MRERSVQRRLRLSRGVVRQSVVLQGARRVQTVRLIAGQKHGLAVDLLAPLNPLLGSYLDLLLEQSLFYRHHLCHL